MIEHERQREVYKVAHLMILLIFTFFSVVLIIESVLLDWETWTIPIILLGVVGSWWLHISKSIPEFFRLWTYTILMMIEFFYYGIHSSSMFDMSVVMAGIMMVYGMSGVISLVNFSEIVYFLTYGYNVYMMIREGQEWTALLVTRILIHPIVMILIGYIIHMIIREWETAIELADEKIDNLQDATHRMDDFLINVSHEIRTPVNAVIGITSVLLEKDKYDEEDRQSLDSIQTAGHRIADQIGDILDYTEIDMRKLMVTNETYMLSSLVNDLVTDIKNSYDTNLEIIIDIDAELPRALSGDAVKLKKIMRHLIGNGIKFTRSGAVYVHMYSQKRPYGINLCIEVKDTGHGMEPEELHHVFDSFYQSDSGRARSTSGLGIGASIVHGFVCEMGGFMTIESKPDAGTTVKISIPQAVVDPVSCMTISNQDKLFIASFLRYRAFDDPQVRQFYNDLIMHLTIGLNLPFYQVESMENLRGLIKKYNLTHVFIGAEEYSAEPSFYENLARKTMVVLVADDDFKPKPKSRVIIIRKPFYCFNVIKTLEAGKEDMDVSENEGMRMTCPGLKVLVVDDEPMNLLVAEGIFGSYGMEVFTAASGPQAISMAKSKKFDIIFMDHMMPEMDGIEAMRRIKADHQIGSSINKDVLFVALTANAVSSARNMFLSEGFDGFVAKPIETIELERTLKRILPKTSIEYIEIQQPAVSEQQEEEIVAETIADPENILFFAGINPNDGRTYCQNDNGFYQTVLLEYGSKAPEKKQELCDFYEKKDLDNYKIRIHALKSTSKMIGVKDLFEKALALENACKEGNADFVEQEHANCMKRYDEVAGAIMDYLKEAAPGLLGGK